MYTVIFGRISALQSVVAGSISRGGDHGIHGKTPINECPDYDTKQSDGEVSTDAGAWGKAEHPFITIAPRSTVARNGSTW